MRSQSSTWRCDTREKIDLGSFWLLCRPASASALQAAEREKKSWKVKDLVSCPRPTSRLKIQTLFLLGQSPAKIFGKRSLFCSFKKKREFVLPQKFSETRFWCLGLELHPTKSTSSCQQRSSLWLSRHYRHFVGNSNWDERVWRRIRNTHPNFSSPFFVLAVKASLLLLPS